MAGLPSTVLDDIRLQERAQIAAATAAIKNEFQRRRWNADPIAWAKERANAILWSKQLDLLESIRKHRRTAVPSCHEVSKTFTAALITGWWLDTHPAGEAFVVTTATTDAQVRAVLWREINRMHSNLGLPGRVNQTEWFMKMRSGHEEMVAFGRKPSDYNPTAFQGIHAPYVLFIGDEANGILSELLEAADSLIANDDSKMVLLGNPDDPRSEFEKACRPGSGYNVVHIGAFDSPNFTGEPLPSHIRKQLIGHIYVEEKRRKWAPHWHWNEDRTACVPPPDSDPADTNPLWQSKVLGRFPKQNIDGGLIPMSWIIAAQMRTLTPSFPVEMGYDVGGGGDANTECVRQGNVYRITHEDHEPDTTKQVGRLIQSARAHKPTLTKIDKIGIGWGVTDRCRELQPTLNAQGIPTEFIGINVGEGATEPTPGEDEEAATDERFANLKAELYWLVREDFERGDMDIDPNDEDLAGQLASIRYERTSSGKIKISDKRKDAQGRTIPSPNRAEALMLARAPKPKETFGPARAIKLSGF
jgi:hypothetical protein